jgi:hypothetical protein
MTVTTSPAPRRRSAHASATLCASVLALCSLPALAQTADRQSDSQVKALIEQVDTARDKFEGNLDNSLKNSTIRSATGERKVSAALQDFQDNTKKLKDRFTEDYSASAEAETVLKQGTAIDTFMKGNPGVAKGRSEWDHLAATLKSLAGVYATTFPLPEGATVRRMNDKETAAAAEDLKNSVDQYRKQIDDDKTLAKADKDAAKKSAENLARAADTLKSRVSDGKPATAEMRSVVDQISKLDAFVMAHPVPLAAASWSGAKTALGKLEQAFNMVPPPVRH